MFGFTAERAIAIVISALIAFGGALLGQITGAFYGARYAARLTRRMQLALADIAFQRQQRERLVRPFLELADRRVAALADFTEAASRTNYESALAIAMARVRTDVVAPAQEA